MLLFIIDATRHTDEYILKYKSEAIEKFKEWKALREKESCQQVKRFRPDGGGEYTSKKFPEYPKSEGILMEMTTPYIPQSIGVVQLANRTIMDRVRCMLDNAGLSNKYWTFAFSVVVDLKKCTPTRFGSQQDSVQLLASEDTCFEPSPCVQMLGVCPCSKRGTKEAG